MKSLACVLWLFAFGATPATYYVSVSGDDLAAGTSTESAWAHHPWSVNATGIAAATVLSPGDLVILKKGDTWYGEYISSKTGGVRGAPITTTTDPSWGTGAAVLSGAAEPASLIWTADGESYKTTLPTEPRIVVWNGTVLTNHDGAHGAVGSKEWDWATNTLFINVGGNPSTGTLLAGQRNYVILTSNNYLTFKDFDLQCANVANGGVVMVNGNHDCVLDELRINYSASSGVLLYAETNNTLINSSISNCMARGVYVKSCSQALVSNNLVCASSAYGIHATTSPNVTISSNKVFCAAGSGIYAVYCSGARVSGNTISLVRPASDAGYGIYAWFCTNVISAHNTIYSNAGVGLYLNQSPSGVALGNTLYGNGRGVEIQGTNAHTLVASNRVFWHWTGNYPNGGGLGIWLRGSTEGAYVTRNYVSSNYLGITITTTGGSGSNVVCYNLVRDQGVNSIDVTGDGGVGISYIHNNTVLHNPAEGNKPPNTGHGISFQIASTRGHVANNLIIVAKSGGNCNGLCYSTTTSNLLQIYSDYNLLFDGTGGHGAIGKLNTKQYTNMADWKAAVQADARITDLSGHPGKAEEHSTAENPLCDTKLRPSWRGGAYNAGTFLGYTRDFLGAEILLAPEMGAYEVSLPDIEVSRYGETWLLLWPAMGPILEHTSSLSPPEWVPWTEPPREVNGINSTEVPATGIGFFRLRYPQVR